jgi:hypothetical protein
MQHTLSVRVGGAFHGEDAHTRSKGHPQARHPPGQTDGINAAQGLGIVKDFHLKLVVEGLLCYSVEGRRAKDPQPCHGNDDNRAQTA